MPWLNDMHSRLNRTHMRQIFQPRSTRDVQKIISQAIKKEFQIIASGARHAMGGQQFLMDQCLLDLRTMRRVREFDPRQGVIRVEAGIQWPELIRWLRTSSRNKKSAWGIIQKQTGADRLTLGGALSSNAFMGGSSDGHPSSVMLRLLILWVHKDEFDIAAERKIKTLFALAIGGYGLFGVITESLAAIESPPIITETCLPFRCCRITGNI